MSMCVGRSGMAPSLSSASPLSATRQLPSQFLVPNAMQGKARQ